MANFNIHDQWLGDVMPQSGVNVAIGRNTADGAQPAVPVTEAHTKLLMLHDTNGSGVVSYNAEDLRLELTPTTSAPSGTQPIVTAVVFDSYDTTGLQTLSTTAITLNLDVERTNTHPDIYVLASDELQINMAGTYMFTYHITGDTTGTTRSSMVLTLERQAPGGAYAAVDGSQVTAMVRNQTVTATATGSVILDDVVVGEKFRLRAAQVTSVVNTRTISGQSGLLVEKLA